MDFWKEWHRGDVFLITLFLGLHDIHMVPLVMLNIIIWLRQYLTGFSTVNEITVLLLYIVLK